MSFHRVSTSDSRRPRLQLGVSATGLLATGTTFASKARRGYERFAVHTSRFSPFRRSDASIRREEDRRIRQVKGRRGLQVVCGQVRASPVSRQVVRHARRDDEVEVGGVRSPSAANQICSLVPRSITARPAFVKRENDREVEARPVPGGADEVDALPVLTQEEERATIGGDARRRLRASGPSRSANTGGRAKGAVPRRTRGEANGSSSPWAPEFLERSRARPRRAARSSPSPRLSTGIAA